ncbi:MAG: type II toxin-antitoxin system RelE/ParE family toxin [Candidatus Limnocylindrales bacterium]
MATVVVTPTAVDNLDTLVRTLSLPRNTRERVKSSLRPLSRFPRLGAPLEGRWAEFRFILGPWRWMLIVYAYDEAADTVYVVTIQDARSATAAKSAP